MVNTRKQIIEKELLSNSLSVNIKQTDKLNKFEYLFKLNCDENEICTVELTVYKKHVVIDTIIVWEEKDRLCGVGKYVLDFIQNTLQKEIRLFSGYSVTGFYKSLGYKNYNDKSLFKFSKKPIIKKQ